MGLTFPAGIDPDDLAEQEQGRRKVQAFKVLKPYVPECFVRIDDVIAREFLTRCAASLGIFHAPLEWKDIAAIEWNALVYPLRRAGLGC